MLQQSTQRRLCRSVFVLACVLPTLVVQAWVVWRVQPGYQRQQLEAFVAPLGLAAEFDRRDTAQPGLAVFSNVRLADAETGALVAALDVLSTRRTPAGAEVHGGLLVVEPENLAPLAAALRGSLANVQAGDAQIRFDRVQITGRGEWANVVVTSRSTGGRPELGRSLEVFQESPDGVRVALHRNRQVSPPATRLVVDTRASQLAWNLVAPLAPLPSDLGQQSTWQGKLEVGLESRTGKLAGQIQQASLDKLLPEQASLTTRQPAELSSLVVEWQAERFELFDVEVRCGQGAVATPFINMARSCLQCAPVGEFYALLERLEKLGYYPPELSPLEFDQMALRIRADRSGIQITGLPENRRDGLATWVLQRGGSPLLFEPRTDRTPIEALLHVVKTPGVESPYQCPRAVELAKRLPLKSQQR
ncbi:MAG: hypothetical protein KDA37_06135 [Planctomycetales bacterium]|nr:hypothetical protein [Planctomycetales bacterium]